MVPTQPPAASNTGGPTTTPALPAPPTRFHVQVGSFDTREAADALLRQLRGRGYAATLVEGPPFRVWVGGYLDRATAERLVTYLRSSGFDAILSPR